jgi:hypothetical protein
MLYKELRASRMIALLAQLGIKSAKEMSIEDAVRQERKLRRSMDNVGSVPMSLGALAAYSTKRRRARQTHPGKR